MIQSLSSAGCSIAINVIKARPKCKKMQKLMRVRKLDHKVRKYIKNSYILTDIKNSANISLRS